MISRCERTTIIMTVLYINPSVISYGARNKNPRNPIYDVFSILFYLRNNFVHESWIDTLWYILITIRIYSNSR